MSGHVGDSPHAKPLLENVLLESEMHRIRAGLGDKGYDSNDHVKYLDSLDVEDVIPPKKNPIEQREICLELYRDRNKIEWSINGIKHYRRVATRYEKTARNYLSRLRLVSPLVWLLSRFMKLPFVSTT